MKIKMNRSAFSMIEIVIALLFVSFALVPIYNLFRVGSQGTANNIHEVTASNYASDLVNFVRDLKPREIESLDDRDVIELESDGEISNFFQSPGLIPPPRIESPFKRKLTLTRFEGRDITGLFGFVGAFRDFFNQRQNIKNYLIHVRVEFPRMNNSSGTSDSLTLMSILMD